MNFNRGAHPAISRQPNVLWQSSWPFCFALCFAIMIPCWIGCRSDTVEAKGILKINGNPVTHSSATVEFYPVEGGRTANAAVAEDGSFIVSYLKPGDGLPAGKYRVAVIADAPITRSRSSNHDLSSTENSDFVANPGAVRHLVPQVYNNIETTPLEYEVIDDGNPQFIELDIQVETQ